MTLTDMMDAAEDAVRRRSFVRIREFLDEHPLLLAAESAARQQVGRPWSPP